MKISIDDMSTLHRMLGIIEGAAYGMGKRESVIYDAVENINSILDKAEVVLVDLPLHMERSQTNG